MHRSRRSEHDATAMTRSGQRLTLQDIHRSAEEALKVTPRIVAPGQQVDVSALHHAEDQEAKPVYSVRAMDTGEALVIQERGNEHASPFSGLLISKASAAGHPPRILFDMGPLQEGSIQLVKAGRMLDAVVQHASLR